MRKFLYGILLLVIGCGLTPYEQHLKTMILGTARTSASYTLVTLTNTFTAASNYTVDVNDVQIDMYLWGAGGANNSANGGAGGYTFGQFTITSGNPTQGLCKIGTILTLTVDSSTGTRTTIATNTTVVLCSGAGGGGGYAHGDLYGSAVANGGGGGGQDGGDAYFSGSTPQIGQLHGYGGNGTTGGNGVNDAGGGGCDYPQKKSEVSGGNGSGSTGGNGGSYESDQFGNSFTITGGRGGNGWTGGGGGGIAQLTYCNAWGQAAAGGGAGGANYIQPSTFLISSNLTASGTTIPETSSAYRSDSKGGPSQGGCIALKITRKQY